MPKRPRLALTLGDPAGIGPEIVARALRRAAKRFRVDLVVVGHREILRAAAPRGTRRAVEQVEVIAPMPWRGRLPTPGRWSQRSGRLSLAYVECGVQLCLQGAVDGLVTAPICKAAWHRAGTAVPGHTELLAKRCGTDQVVMMLAGAGLRVALATIHEPLARVPRLLTVQGLVGTAWILHRSLQQDFGLRRPRIGVLGLNPHAGEAGHLGQEEKRVIEPALRRLRRRGVDARGPLPADTAFVQARAGVYDAVLAMYHDQGLGPLKTVAFDCGVNITLGLPIVRTSPDHGTAFDIAGQGRATADSMLAAIDVARGMVLARSKR